MGVNADYICRLLLRLNAAIQSLSADLQNSSLSRETFFCFKSSS